MESNSFIHEEMQGSVDLGECSAEICSIMKRGREAFASSSALACDEEKSTENKKPLKNDLMVTRLDLTCHAFIWDHLMNEFHDSFNGC